MERKRERRTKRWDEGRTKKRKKRRRRRRKRGRKRKGKGQEKGKEEKRKCGQRDYIHLEKTRRQRMDEGLRSWGTANVTTKTQGIPAEECILQVEITGKIMNEIL